MTLQKNSLRRSGLSSHVRFTEYEYNRLQKMKMTTGLSIPDLLKKALFNRMDLERPLLNPDDVSKIMEELRRQGNNINQIAKQINSGLLKGWNHSFNALVRSYQDIRHMISVNRANG